MKKTMMRRTKRSLQGKSDALSEGLSSGLSLCALASVLVSLFSIPRRRTSLTGCLECILLSSS